MISEEEVFHIGRLGKPHGVRGEITFMFTDDIFDRVDADYLIVEVDGILVPFFIEEYRFKSNETAWIVFDGITTVEQARELTNCEVYFPRILSDHTEEEMTWEELVGYQITDIHEGVVGKIVDVDDSTENILFYVDHHGKTVLLPAADDLIIEINNQEKIITTELPEGLLDLS